MHGIPGNHKPQWTRRVQRQCKPLSSCPHSGRELWLHETMENQHFQAFLMPTNRGKLLTIEHTFRQSVSMNRSMRTVAEFQPQVSETLFIQTTRQKTSRLRLIPLWLVPRETKRLRQQNGCLLELRPGSVLFCLKHINCGQKWKWKRNMQALKSLTCDNHDTGVHILRDGCFLLCIFQIRIQKYLLDLTKAIPHMLNLF